MAEVLVVVGGGVAGITAAEVARSLNPEARIVVFSDEEERLYSRVLLPKYCEGKIAREKVFLRKQEWAAQQAIEVVHAHVDHLGMRDGGVGVVCGEKEWVAHRVLVATGGKPREHRWRTDARAHHLQTLADADRLIAAMESAKERGGVLRAVVMGGSFIAMEFVNILTHHGFQVEVRLRGDRLFSHLLPQAMSDVVRAHVEARGVRVVSRAAEEPIDDDVCLIGVGTGIEMQAPNHLPLGPEGGVFAGEELAVEGWSAPGTDTSLLRTAGDCAEFADVQAERRHIAGNWMNATMQGRYAGAWLAGKPLSEPYRCTTSYNITVLGLDVVALGDAAIGVSDTRVEVVAHEGGFAVECWRRGRLVGVTLVNANAMRAHYAKQLS
jgi:nitrite reductase (NADH) large subunit